MATDPGARAALRRRPLTVCLTGPESTGKTRLAEALAEHLDVPLVPEVARAFLETRPAYEAHDVLEIAARQIAAEEEARAAHPGLVVCDTDLLVIQIWWSERYGALPERLVEALASRSPRVYLLAYPDLPWAPDALREHPNDRMRLFALYESELTRGPFRYGIVTGSGEERFESALQQLERLLGI